MACAMDIHQSTASNLVRALSKKGLIGTSRDERDRRVVHLHVTEAGRVLLAETPGPFAGMLPHALGQLDAATLQRLSKDLAVLIAVLEVEDAHLAAQTPLAEL